MGHQGVTKCTGWQFLQGESSRVTKATWQQKDCNQKGNKKVVKHMILSGDALMNYLLLPFAALNYPLFTTPWLPFFTLLNPFIALQYPFVSLWWTDRTRFYTPFYLFLVYTFPLTVFHYPSAPLICLYDLLHVDALVYSLCQPTSAHPLLNV